MGQELSTARQCILTNAEGIQTLQSANENYNHNPQFVKTALASVDQYISYVQNLHCEQHNVL